MSTGTYKRGRFDLFAVRPCVGIKGQSLIILSNHYGVSYDLNKSIYSYYASINQVNSNNNNNISNNNNSSTSSYNKAKNEQIYRNVMKRLIDNNSQPGNIFNKISCIYDGASCLYTSERLPIISDKIIKFRVCLTDTDFGPQDYEVCIKMVSVLTLQTIQDYYQNPINDAHIETIRSINLVVRHLFLSMRFLVGRSSFHCRAEDDVRYSISSLKEISYGVFSSVQACSSGLQLILDRSCAPFMKPLTIDDAIRLFVKDCGSQRWNDFVRKKLDSALKDYIFEVTHLSKPRRYKITGLTSDSANKIMFVSNQDGNRMISVADYFSKTYFPLRYPDMACVKVRKSKNDFIYFPAEVCKIMNDQKARKLTIKEKADMIRNAASVIPSERFEIIRMTAKDLMDRDKTTNYLRDFGINIATQPVAIKARVLEAPRLLEGDKQEIKPVHGKWRINKFYKPVSLNQWILVLMVRFDDSVIDRFIDALTRYGEQLGIRVKPPKKVRYSFDNKNLSNFFGKTSQSFGNIDLFFFLGCDSEHQYNAIKKAGDIDYSIPTQCMRQANVFRINQSISVNVLQKINIKLGGINVSVDIDKMPLFIKQNFEKILVVGADVAHPSPTERNCPSIAALVANCNADFTRYTASVKIQKYFRQEIIQELDKMLLELLSAYESNMNILPDKIVFYRDGVSEGQFRTVYDEEVRLIKDTLAKYRPGYKPKLTFIIVQKRHHTRFMPDNSKDGVGKSCNVPPGTVVDSEVVHPRNFDFYLCSHAGIQGTSRPSHYCVLVDENSLIADELQELTNMLCHLYARCSRSISIPTPVYYAHLAAFRARAHIQAAILVQKNFVDTESKMKIDYFSSSPQASKIHYTKHRVPCIDNFDAYIEMSLKMRCSMYFC